MLPIYYDFHMHSCLSPCGDEDMTPGNLAGMAALAGFQAVALTDHNTVGNCRAFCHQARRQGLIPLPGMELTTREEVHVVCLFDVLDRAEAFGRMVYDRLPPIENDPALFGRQVFRDEQDEEAGEETRLLASATDIGVYDAAALAAEYGGFAYPAHIDRNSFSLLSNLGLWDAEMGFTIAETSRTCDRRALMRRPDLSGVPLIWGCDAHYLEDIPDAKFQLSVEAATPAGVLQALRRLGEEGRG